MDRSHILPAPTGISRTIHYPYDAARKVIDASPRGVSDPGQRAWGIDVIEEATESYWMSAVTA